jgi:hypothetical protein
MTKIPRWLALTGLTGLAIGAGLWLGLGETAPGPHPPATSPALPGSGVTQNDAPPITPAERDAMLQSPAVQGYRERLRFAADYRAFIANAATLSAQERQRQAVALAEAIDRREAAGELALSEALLLQIGLVQAAGGDEEAQKARADALLARYQALSQEREEKAKAPDARFSRYKAEERRIVDEVLALDSIPDGLSRDQYLRQRLQQAREQAYQ